MAAPTFAQMRGTYATLWAGMKINPGKLAEIDAVVRRILVNKAIYQSIEARTGVPWFFIGCLHYREGNLDLSTYLGNGEPLDRPTRLVPAGRGPFFQHPGEEPHGAFIRGAIDALEAMGFQKI